MMKMQVLPKRKAFSLFLVFIKFSFFISFCSFAAVGYCDYTIWCNNVPIIIRTGGPGKTGGPPDVTPGDPVDLRTGNQILAYADFSIPSTGFPLELSRTYTSKVPFSLKGWVWASGQWQVENGIYEGSGGRLLTVGEWNNFNLTVNVKTVQSDGTHPWETAYVDFRFQDLGNWCYFLIRSDGILELTRYKNGVQNILVQKASSYSPFDNNKINIQAEGANISVYVNDNLEITCTDPDPLTWGKIGLDACQYNRSQFANVSMAGYNSSFVDDFSGQNWTPSSGTWRVNNEEYQGQNGMTATNLAWTDTTIEADVKTVTAGQNSWDVAFVNFRYTNNQNNYYFLIHTDGQLELTKNKNGNWSQLVTKASGYNPSDYNHVKIDATGAEIKIYVNSNLEIDYADTDPLIGGKVAFDTENCSASYKNAEITGKSVSFTDTFDSSSGQWTPQSGSWAIQSGEYTGNSGLSLLNNALTDFNFDVDVKTVTPGQNSWDVAFINFRYTDNQNNYYFLIHTDGQLELTKLKNGNWSQLVTKSSSYDPTVYNHVTVNATGGEIKIYVNSSLEIDYTDTDPLTSGSVGVNASYCSANFDNVALAKPVSVSDGFRSNTDWSVASGTWGIANQEYSGNGGLSLSQISSWANFNLDVDAKTITPGQNSWDTAFINFRYTDNQNYYYFLIHTDGQLELTKLKNGNWSQLVTKSSSYDPTVYNHVTVNATGGEIKIYVNSNLEIDYTDSDPLIQGAVGLAPYNCLAHFDNVNTHEISQGVGDTSGEWVGMFGRNWQSNIEIRLEENSATGEVYAYKQNSIKNIYTRNGNGTYNPPTGVLEILTKSSSGFTLRDKFGKVYLFDLWGKLTSVTDRNGNSITIAYSGQKPIAITDTYGRSISLAYNSQGFVSQATDPAGRITYYAYDTHDNLTSVTDPRGHATTYTYDTNSHDMTSVTDRNGHSLTYTYYYNDQVKTQTDALGNITTYTYDWYHAYVTNGNDDTYVYTFDDATNITSITDPAFNIESYGYDSNRNMTSSTDKNGHTITYTYDSNGNILTKTDAQGHTTTYTYEPNYSQATSITDARSNVTTNTYDSNGNLTSITDPQNNATTFTYDQHGRLLTKTDALNHTTTYTYDQHGNLLSVTDPLSNVTAYTYNIIGKPLTVTDARNNTMTYAYDLNNNVAQITDALTNLTAFTYDNENNLLTTTDAQNNVTTNQYDAMDDLIQVTDAQNNVTQYTYDLTDYMYLGTKLKTSATDAKSNTTTYTYNNIDRLTQIVDALSHTTSYAYDNAGNKTSVTDANSHITTYAYDSVNRLVNTTLPDSSYETYSYDLVGNMTQKVTRKGDAINFTYDSLNRVTAKTYPDQSQVTYTYDTLSRLLTATDSSGTITHAYDALGRLTSATYPNSMVVSYQYDAVGNRTRLTYPDSTYLAYTFDGLNRPTEIDDQNQTMISTFTYDTLSRRANLTLANGVTTSYTYDSLSRLLSLINQKSPTTISSFVYTYDQVGNRTSMTTQAGTYNYTYDNICQLTQVQKPGPIQKTYNLDPVGNRTTVVEGTTQAYTANNLNQYTAIDSFNLTYDNNGNLIQKTDGSITTTYTYDYENRLKTVTQGQNGAVFTYDAFGRRTSKEVNSILQAKYLYDQKDIILDLDSNNNIIAKYIYGPWIDESLVMTRGSNVYYCSRDALGSTANLTDSTGSIVESYTYDEYGNVSAPSQVGNRYLYTGREYDSETGLYSYRARYYDPTMGRFLQTDPIGYEGGINLYAYVENAPINRVDPLGLSSILGDWYGYWQSQGGGWGTGSQAPAQTQYEKNVKAHIEQTYDPEWIKGEGGIDAVWKKYRDGGLIIKWNHPPVPINPNSPPPSNGDGGDKGNNSNSNEGKHHVLLC